MYYAAVRVIGGNDATKRDVSDELVREYEEKLAIYEQLVKEAQDAGLLAVERLGTGYYLTRRERS